MPTYLQTAAGINLRVRQLEADSVRGLELARLCDRFPGSERVARLMEEVSARKEAMTANGTHPYVDIRTPPQPQAVMLTDTLRDAAEIEWQHRTAQYTGTLDLVRSERLATMRRRWADGLERAPAAFRSSDGSPRAQAVVQNVLKATADRIVKLGCGGGLP